MSNNTLASEAGFRMYLTELFETTSNIFQKDGSLYPVAHLAIRINPETDEKLDEPGILTMICSSMRDEREKETWVLAIRQLCTKTDAVAVVVVNEAWMVKAEANEIDEKGNMRVRPIDHPRRIEVVSMMVEHAKFGCEIWSAEIIRDGDKATLGEFSKSDDGPLSVRGRFTQFIPQRTMN
jgi:hypothetical protein